MTGLRSTTTLMISGDQHQPCWNRWRYRWHHWRRNRRENRTPFGVEIPWPPQHHGLKGRLDDLDADGWPARRLCDLFWADLDWTLIARVLGPLRIHDLGCGDGRYAAKLRRWCASPLQYFGYDVQARDVWADRRDDGTSLEVFDGANFANTLACEPNLCISQSALEHVPMDLGYFDAVTEYTRGGKPLLQIHMVPGATGLRQWGLHGYRHYTRDAIRAIQEAAPKDARVSLFCLGDERYVDLHLRYARRPGMKNDTRSNPRALAAYLREFAQLLDTPRAAAPDQAAFLAIVVECALPLPLASRLTTSMS